MTGMVYLVGVFVNTLAGQSAASERRIRLFFLHYRKRGHTTQY
jgi:hypothetical protein